MLESGDFEAQIIEKLKDEVQSRSWCSWAVLGLEICQSATCFIFSFTSFLLNGTCAMIAILINRKAAAVNCLCIFMIVY